MRNKLLLSGAAILIVCTVGAQPVFNIADGSTQNFICSGPAILTDSNADNGNYLPNEVHEITVQADGVSPVQVIISPAQFGHTWDVDAQSTLAVYNGPTSASPLLGFFNSIDDPNGIVVSGGSSLTFVFTSGPTSSGEGFTARIQCASAFQPFMIDFAAEPAFVSTNVSEQSITLCSADSFSVNAIVTYPLGSASGNGYPQDDETSFFNWQMGDGTSYQGIGLTEVTHAYSDGSGYQATLQITDQEGTVQIATFFVLQSPRPNYSNVALSDSLCINTQTIITGGINEATLDTVGFGPGTGAIQGGGINGTQFDAFDETCVTFSQPIEIDVFEDGQTITSTNDILNICLNIYHTFVGDLEFAIVCPSLDTLILFDMYVSQSSCGGLFEGGFVGGGTDLGLPNVPQGFDYCFTENDPEFGTFGDEYPGMPGTMTAGSYLPMGNISDLIGCPLNGTWQLIFQDNWVNDVGVINSWSIIFDPNLSPGTSFYTPTVVEAGWDDNPDLIVQEDGVSVAVTPQEVGDNAFTFFTIDEFGCRHDTTIFIYVRPEVEAFDDIACDLTHQLVVANAVSGGTWEMISSPNPTSTASFENLEQGFANVSVNDYGLYEFEITEVNCDYQDVALIDFRPNPQISPFVPDTVLCNNASITFNAGVQEANAENFEIRWTFNGQVINTSDYSIVADQTGQYILQITGNCAIATDTSDVVAIQLNFTGDTLCGLIDPAVEATLDPPGNGFWTSPSDNISFSNASGLITSVNSTQYGLFDVVFTDSRCPNDGETRTFRFVEQPVISIIPAFPDFCIDLDSLNLTTSVSGNNTGDFTWSVNGVPEQVTEGRIGFGPETFEPLVTNTINVRVVDNFGVCEVATGTASFDGKWCEYTIPNVITPNGDGANDTWDIQHIEFFPNTMVRVFNRWGKLVYEQSNYDQFQKNRGGRGWDPGDLSEGVYFYEVALPQLRRVETGNLTILRHNQARR